jgi:hypothetical protein
LDGSISQLLFCIAEFCRDLKQLTVGPSLCFDSSLADTGCLEILARSCPLVAFIMTGKNSKVHTFPSSLHYIFRNTQYLQKVVISHMCCTQYRSTIRSLAIHNQNLKILDINLAELPSSFADLIPLTLTKYTPLLEVFRFKPASMFSDDAIILLFEECTFLRIFDVPGSIYNSNDALLGISKYGNNLEEINISFWDGIDAEGLRYLKACPRLKRIICVGVA